MKLHAIAVLAVLASLTAAAPASAELPARPDNVRKDRLNDSEVLITWRDNSGNENGFRIYRTVPPSEEYELRGSVTANTREFLDDAERSPVFLYKVVAFNGDGESEHKNLCYVNRNPPAVPLYFNVRMIALHVMRVSWSDRSKGERGFEIQRSHLGKPFKTVVRVAANTETYDDYTLEPANEYVYRVRALGRPAICWGDGKFTPERTDTTLGGERTLTIELLGRGKGTVTSSPPGISCGFDDDHCSAEFPLATDVIITAKSEKGSHFAGWGGIYRCEGLKDPCVAYMGKDRVISAPFKLNQ
jgi:hypothetical protein